MAEQGNLCPVCLTRMEVRRWHVLDVPSLSTTISRLEDAPLTTISQRVIDTCSQACGRVLDRWLDERKKWAGWVRCG